MKKDNLNGPMVYQLMRRKFTHLMLYHLKISYLNLCDKMKLVINNEVLWEGI